MKYFDLFLQETLKMPLTEKAILSVPPQQQKKKYMIWTYEERKLLLEVTCQILFLCLLLKFISQPTSPFFNLVSLTHWSIQNKNLIIFEKVVSIWQRIWNGSFQHQIPSSPLPTTIICLFFFFFPLISLFRMTHLSIKHQQIPYLQNLASFTSRNQACRMQSNNPSC